MYRYQGNTGRSQWVPEPSGGGRQPRPTGQPAPQGKPGKGEKMPPPWNFGSGIQHILSGVFSDGFEMEDALLLLILFLLYKESGDKELLVIMGAMFLL